MLTRKARDELVNIQIPLLVNEMAAWELNRPKQQMFLETVEEVLPSGTTISTTEFVCFPSDLRDHLQRAKRMGLEITVTDTRVEIIRPLKNGSHYRAVYRPIAD